MALDEIFGQGNYEGKKQDSTTWILKSQKSLTTKEQNLSSRGDDTPIGITERFSKAEGLEEILQENLEMELRQSPARLDTPTTETMSTWRTFAAQALSLQRATTTVCSPRRPRPAQSRSTSPESRYRHHRHQ